MIDKGGQRSKSTSKFVLSEKRRIVRLMCSDPAEGLQHLAANNALTAHDSPVT